MSNHKASLLSVVVISIVVNSGNPSPVDNVAVEIGE